MYNYRKWIKDESRDIAVESTKHPQFCNCRLCIDAQIYIKNLVKERVALSKFDSHGRPIGSQRRRKWKFVEDKNFDPNGPFFKILDNRGRELEKERQDLEQQECLLSIQLLFGEQSASFELLFDKDCPKPTNSDDLPVTVDDAKQDENLHIALDEDLDNAMYGILGVYCSRI